MIVYVASRWFDGLDQRSPERNVGPRLHSNYLLRIGWVDDQQAGLWGGMSSAVLVRGVYFGQGVPLGRWPRCWEADLHHELDCRCLSRPYAEGRMVWGSVSGSLFDEDGGWTHSLEL